MDHETFQAEFKDLLALITQDSIINEEGVGGRHDLVQQARLGKAERFQQEKARIYNQSTSPTRPELKERKRKVSSVRAKKVLEILNDQEQEGDAKETDIGAK